MHSAKYYNYWYTEKKLRIEELVVNVDTKIGNTVQENVFLLPPERCTQTNRDGQL